MSVGEGDGGTRFGDGLLSGPGVSEQFKAPLSTGSVIDGKYRLERLIGEGGMGAVWRAQHIALDLPVAIKLLRAGTEQTKLSERLKIEARAAAQLTHPAIVRVFDVDTTETGEPYIVMELLSGESLSDVLDRGRLSPVSAVQIMLPIAEALAVAHGKGIVHRDLKPHNVFMADDGDRLQPKLLDFGIAKLTLAPVDGSLTDTGIPIGSPDYMSPEQARGVKDVDYRADIWSFCVVLYEAVRGDIPFHGDNYNALMRAIVETEPAPLPVEGELDQRLADLISWGLAKEREQRPESLQELGRELARWLLDRGVKEDVCGTPLGPKWITRTAQKSVPVILPNESEPPPPLPSGDVETLVSPRLPRAATVASRARNEMVSEAQPAPASKRWPLVVGVSVLLAAAGLAWALTRPAGPPGARSPAPSAASALSAQPSALAPVIAATPPLPPTSAPAIEQVAPPSPPTLAEPDRGKSVPKLAAPSSQTSKPAGAKRSVEAAPPPPAPKPARDARDGARELLQAY